MVRVRLADSRDRDAIRVLRQTALVHKALDGGLYELLTWPVYHTHAATLDGVLVGYASTILLPAAQAELSGLVVAAAHRRLGVGRLLLGTQARDLSMMGWRVLYAAAPSEDASAFLDALGGVVLGGLTIDGFPPHTYYRLTLDAIPHDVPLTAHQISRLQAKATQAREGSTGLAGLTALNQFGAAKAALRG